MSAPLIYTGQPTLYAVSLAAGLFSHLLTSLAVPLSFTLHWVSGVGIGFGGLW